MGDDEIEQLALLASLRREVTASRALLAAAEDAVLLLATVSGTGEEGDEDGDGTISDRTRSWRCCERSWRLSWRKRR